MKIKAFVFLALSFTSIIAMAQDEKPCQENNKNKKAVKAYTQGIDKKNKKDERMRFLKEAMDLEPDYVDANFAYAEERIKTMIFDDAPSNRLNLISKRSLNCALTTIRIHTTILDL